MASKLRKRDGNGSGGGLSLPEDIIFDVLVRLPAKALCRFHCVCKAWRTLISDPAFVAVQRSRAGPLIIAMFGSTTTERHELRLLDKDSDVLSMFDVRALALLVPTHLDLIFVYRMQPGATIIDPASRRVSPVVGMPNPYWAGSTVTLLNDYRFGRASPWGDYKVLHVVVAPRRPRSYYGYSEWCEVATIIDDGAEEPTWRQRPWAPFRTSTSCEHKATVNGVLYFMPHVLGSRARNQRAAFDLESEEWKPKTIKGPPRLGLKKETDKWSIALAELKGTLCMVHNIQHLTSLGGHYANIWLLTDPSRGIWVKEYTIRMPGRLLLSTKPLDVLGDGTTLLLLNMFRKAGNIESYHRYILQFYNSSTETFTDFMEMSEGFNGRMAFYTGSLLCLRITSLGIYIKPLRPCSSILND